MEECECDSDGEPMIINDQDGLPNVHPNLIPEADINSSPGEQSEDELDGLPSSLIVTNIHENVYGSREKMQEIEDLFKFFDSEVTFQWLKSFKRLRVNFNTPLQAANARIQLHQYSINDSVITCYFAQPVTPVKNSTLQPPAPYKQFLISPPASPPVGWEPRPEGEPIVNSDLIAALASLSPGSSHELHPPGEGQPGIVVHTALGVKSDGSKPKIMQTTCPERA